MSTETDDLVKRLRDLGIRSGTRAANHIEALEAENAKLRGALAPIGRAAADVWAERLRQIESEKWSPQHDDEHSCGELADAAACYASPAPHGLRVTAQDDPPKIWPWHRSWWKPKDRRSNLVRAGALILAEIERLDRARAALEGT